MELDEAIKHAEKVAELKEKQVKNGDWEKDSVTERDCVKCAEEHRQLANWLRELKRLRNYVRPVMPEENLQDAIICGYFVRDLIVTAERLRKEGVDPHKLRMSCDDFLEGYKTAHEEIHRQIEKSVQDMLGNIRELPTEERPKTDGGEDERQNQTGD